MSKIYMVETFNPDGRQISTALYHESEIDDLIFQINRNPDEKEDTTTHKVWSAEISEWISIA